MGSIFIGSPCIQPKTKFNYFYFGINIIFEFEFLEPNLNKLNISYSITFLMSFAVSILPLLNEKLHV